MIEAEGRGCELERPDTLNEKGSTMRHVSACRPEENTMHMKLSC